MEESTGFAKVSDFRFLMDLHVLGCPEHDLTTSVCLCVFDKNFVASVAREHANAQNEILYLVLF